MYYETKYRPVLSDVHWIIGNWPKLCAIEESIFDDKDQDRLLQERLSKHNITAKNHG